MDELQPMNLGADLPVFDNAKDGLAFLDQQEEEAMRQLHEEAQRQMDERSEDPSAQNYFMRIDKKTVVKDEAEYQWCLAKQIPMKVIPYGHALQLLKVEDARKAQRLKAKRKKKTAKASRKKNRR
jgi:hypothetical protein